MKTKLQRIVEAKKFLMITDELKLLSREHCRRKQSQWKSLKETRYLLSPREYKLLKMRFRDGMCLEEVGKEFGVTRERIRQIEGKVIQKLKDL